MRSILAGLAALAFSPAIALAQDVQDAPEAPETENTTGDIVVEGEIDEREIERCRMVRVTGTRFRERVCMSRNDLDEQRRNNRDMLNDLRYQGEPIIEVNDEGIPSVPPV